MLLSFITSRLGKYAALAIAGLGIILAIYRKGRGDEERAHELKTEREYRKTRQKADEALRKAEADTRNVDERLKEKGHLRNE